MINYFDIPIAKDLFVASITSKNGKEQYADLEGLENYYDVSEEDIEDELVEILISIKDETEARVVVSTCLQILINAGIIDEMMAQCEIEDWKDDHYY